MAYGDNFYSFLAPGASYGSGRAVAFDGQYLYLTKFISPVGNPAARFIYKVPTDGSTVVDTISTQILYGSLHYDPNEKVFWAGGYENTYRIQKMLIDGTVLVYFPYDSIVPLDPDDPYPGYVDGITMVDNTIFFSTAWGRSVYKMSKNGHYLGKFPIPQQGTALKGYNTGMTSDGKYLYLVLYSSAFSDLPADIVQTDLEGNKINSFSFGQYKLIDLAYDSVTYKPKCAVWSNELEDYDNYIRAWEVNCEKPITRGVSIFK